MGEITRKDNLNRNIGKMLLKHGKAYNFVPKSYILPQEMSLLISDHEKNRSTRKFYIVKPPSGSQGKGIYITNDVDDVSL